MDRVLKTNVKLDIFIKSAFCKIFSHFDCKLLLNSSCFMVENHFRTAMQLGKVSWAF